ncbi:putative opsin [Peniophora sp. CONT]|nr:putative opsin [Peniophora sp. CONT]
MANTSQKKIASQNEAALKNLLYGQILANIVPFLIRLLYRAFGRRTSIKVWIMSAIATGVSQFLYGRLAALGKPRRDANGTMVSAGSDLNQPGVTEWMFDVLYISWAAQVGSSILGEWVWLLYLVIPVFVIYKAWGFIGPMIMPQSSSAEEEAPVEQLSKRQEKLKKRSERGDPRVKTQQRRA